MKLKIRATQLPSLFQPELVPTGLNWFIFYFFQI